MNKHLIIYCFFICLNLFGCKNQNPPQRLSAPKVILAHPVSEFIFTIDNRVLVTSKEQLIGTWNHYGKENVVIEFTNNTYFEREHNLKRKYTFDGDSVRVYFNDYTWTWKPFLSSDSLLMINREGYVFKNTRVRN